MKVPSKQDVEAALRKRIRLNELEFEENERERVWLERCRDDVAGLPEGAFPQFANYINQLTKGG